MSADTIEAFISRTYRTFFDYVVEDEENYTTIRRIETLRVRRLARAGLSLAQAEIVAPLAFGEVRQ